MRQNETFHVLKCHCEYVGATTYLSSHMNLKAIVTGKGRLQCSLLFSWENQHEKHPHK